MTLPHFSLPSSAAASKSNCLATSVAAKDISLALEDAKRVQSTATGSSPGEPLNLQCSGHAMGLSWVSHLELSCRKIPTLLASVHKNNLQQLFNTQLPEVEVEVEEIRGFSRNLNGKIQRLKCEQRSKILKPSWELRSSFMS